METKRRSVAKSLSWRVFATLITGLVGYMLTGQASFGVKIGLIDSAIKLFVYFGHERLWNIIPYGRIDAPDYEV